MYNFESDFVAFDGVLKTAGADFFSAGKPIFIARAPGRLDVMGGIAEYSGSLVAEYPIALSAICAAQADPDSNGVVTVQTAGSEAAGLQPDVALPAEVFTNPVSLLRWLREQEASRRWAGYVAGTVSILRAEGLIPRRAGVRFLLHSDIPRNCGLSSSSAIEVASMRAVCAAFDITLNPLELAQLCQRIETDIIDVPCGIMDQITSTMGQAGELLVMQCQPHTIKPSLQIPSDLSLIGLTTGVTDIGFAENYSRVRVAAFMGYKILSDRAKSGFGGYLCNLSAKDYLALVEQNPLPETLLGSEFLLRHQGIFDTIATVSPDVPYPVRSSTENSIYENARVAQFVNCLSMDGATAITNVGLLMEESHRGFSSVGLENGAGDLLVNIARKQGDGVIGAKSTGYGLGGTVCVLVKKDQEEQVISAIQSEYYAKSGTTARFLVGSSPGALATPVRVA